MKKILSILAGLFMLPLGAFAAPVTSAQLMGLGMPAQLASKVASIGNGTTSTEWGVNGTTELTLTDDTLTFSGAAASLVGGATSLTLTSAGTVILKGANDSNRLLTYSGTSDSALALAFGDGGTTATQVASVTHSTADADDDGTLVLSSTSCKSGDCTARGANIQLFGNESGSGGSATVQLGGTVNNFKVVGANGSISLLDIEDNGDTATWATDLILNVTGKTLHIDSGTAASACAGTVTANGTTAVTVSTTCAATGARIFLTRTSAPSGTAQCWYDTIVNGTSFNLDCDGAETGTFAWWIQKEG